MNLLDAIIMLLIEIRDGREDLKNLDIRLKKIENQMPEAGYHIVSEPDHD